MYETVDQISFFNGEIGTAKMPTTVNAGHRARMRERYVEHNGFESFNDQEALEMLLFYCVRQNDTSELAHKMINEYGSLSSLFDTNPLDIAKRCDVSEYVSVLITMIPQLAKLYAKSKWDKNVRLVSSSMAGKYLIDLFSGRNTEAFYILCLDAQRRLNHAVLVSEGSVEEAPIYIRNIVEMALLHNSVSIVLSHNHPGGSKSASGADIEATRQIIRAFELLEINVLDHIIVADCSYYSFAENGGLLGLRY